MLNCVLYPLVSFPTKEGEGERSQFVYPSDLLCIGWDYYLVLLYTPCKTVGNTLRDVITLYFVTLMLQCIKITSECNICAWQKCWLSVVLQHKHHMRCNIWCTSHLLSYAAKRHKRVLTTGLYYKCTRHVVVNETHLFTPIYKKQQLPWLTKRDNCNAQPCWPLWLL